jgi:hypothetical protein
MLSRQAESDCLAVDDRQQHVHFRGREVGRHVVAQARVKPVQVAPQGVDFAVVRQQPEGLGQLPARKRVGREPRVHHAKGRGDPLVAKVGEVAAHLVGGQLALVHNDFAGERGEVKVRSGRANLFDHGFFDEPPQHVQLALEVVGLREAGGPAHEHLLHGRLARPGRGANAGRVHRHGPVAQHGQAELRRRRRDALVAGGAGGRVFRHGHHAHAVAARLGQADAQAGALFQEKPVGHLQQQAGPVAGVGVAAAGAAVLHVFEHGERVGDDAVRFAAVEVGDESSTTGIMLKFGAVQALGIVGGWHCEKYSPGEKAGCLPAVGQTRAPHGAAAQVVSQYPPARPAPKSVLPTKYYFYFSDLLIRALSINYLVQ